MEKKLQNYLESVKKFSAEKNEPAWMLEKRLDALEKADELELPKIERVRYERWPLLPTDEFKVGDAATYFYEENNDGPRLVQYDEVTVSEVLPKNLVDQGVIFTDIFTAMEKYPELVEKYFMTAVKPDEDKLAAAHTAFLNGGAFLYVPKNVAIEEPIESLFYQTGRNNIYYHHVLIVAEANSQFSYLERFQSMDNDDKIPANITVEVIAKDGAQVKFSAIDQLGKNVSTYISRRGHLLKDASIDWAIAVMNQGNVIADFDSDLVGDGSHAEIKAVGLSSGKQIQGVDTRVTNFGKNSVGHILQHGVILEAGTLTFNGIGHIIRGAKGADAQQESRVLMLSDKARSDANPILLIDENDVTAGHAASIGQVDPEDLYYLMSRGLDTETAERLVVRGFLGNVIVEVPVKSVRDEMFDVIDRKLDTK
ncbi:Fe-S cluster assembly protein SufD [Floricoccus penangensis]|uniref:Fe-S cluster assembly protein SufD n=1 Tax=Floricoccus penangensis TaxID=1859475 RepID=A0A9Q5NZL1_9LACT|nr:Fe-S cluster assembly protein SufD [Floricoccus penangensis]OFI46640.1 Fe-S cluster assembly protein SufD [Floricoccus penangensis]